MTISSFRPYLGINPYAWVGILFLVLLALSARFFETDRQVLNVIAVLVLLACYTFHFFTKLKMDNRLFSFTTPYNIQIYDCKIKNLLRDECRKHNKSIKRNGYTSPIIRNLARNGKDISSTNFKFHMLSIVVPVLLSFSVSFLDKGSFISIDPAKLQQNCIAVESENPSMVQFANREACTESILNHIIDNKRNIDKSYLLKQLFIIIVIVLITVEFSILLSLNEAVYSGARSIILTSLALDVVSLVAVSAMDTPSPPQPNESSTFSDFYFFILLGLTLWVAVVSGMIIALVKRLDDRYSALCDMILIRYHLGPINQISYEKDSDFCNSEEL